MAAVGTELFVRLRPGAWTGGAEALAAVGTPAAPALSATAVSMRGNAPSWSPYMLLRAMRAQGLSKEQIGRLCESAVAGKNTQQALELAIQPNDPNLEPRSVPEWWADSTHALLTARGDHYESLDVSRAWLRSFMDFTVYRESGAAMENLRALWQRRDEPQLRETLAARHTLIRLRLGQVNPAYYNAAVALGTLYETVLQAEQLHDFIFALTTVPK